MSLRIILDKIEKELTRYHLIIGVLVFIMLCVLALATYWSFDKQDQIIENGGFEDGEIKCVCNQEAWDNHISEQDRSNSLNLSLELYNNGSG